MPCPHRKECMKKMRFVFLALFVVLAVRLQAQEKAPLKLVETIPLPALKDGDFDHFAPDVDGHRLFLTAEENGKVQVLDTNTNKLIHTIEDVKAPHAILYLQDLKKLFIVEGDASAFRVYDSDSYQAVGEIKVSIDADSIAYDPATNYLYVVNGGREAHTPYSLITSSIPITQRGYAISKLTRITSRRSFSKSLVHGCSVTLQVKTLLAFSIGTNRHW